MAWSAQQRIYRWSAVSCAFAAGLALLLATMPTTGKNKKKSADPAEAFSALFEPIEEAMGVTIKAGKMKLNLLSGKVDIAGVRLSHPKQGTFAKATGIMFACGALVGASDPLKAHTSIDEVEVSVDFGGTRFWKVVPPEGGPIPGAPALEMGKLEIRSGMVKLFNGKSAHVSLEGFKANVKQLKVPGKIWSQGKVPAGRWGDITIQGGSFKMSALPYGVDVEKASFHMASRTFHVDAFEASLAAGGGISLEGNVEMAGGSPSAYDLVAELASFRIDRPNLEATASGRLTVTGKPGKVKIGGKLILSDVVTLHAVKWARDSCKSELLLSVLLVPEKGSKFKKAKLKGSTCKGRIVLK
jgi:hypothetical protein